MNTTMTVTIDEGNWQTVADMQLKTIAMLVGQIKERDAEIERLKQPKPCEPSELATVTAKYEVLGNRHTEVCIERDRALMRVDSIETTLAAIAQAAKGPATIPSMCLISGLAVAELNKRHVNGQDNE